MLPKQFDIIVKTFQGLEEVLARELTNLGANNIEIQRRAVRCSVNKSLLYKANFWLRTASRILVPIATFKAENHNQIYDAVKAIPWNEYMTLETTFAIDSTVYSDHFHHSQFVSHRVKDAIVDYFQERYHQRPSVDIKEPGLYLNIHIAQQTCTLSLDSSGESLHKRGYRSEQTEAPLNEALAAGMILLSGWHGESDFIDPMCGSGTLLIEAALIALNIAPGVYRHQFGFERWLDFDEELFNEIYNDDSQERPFYHHIYGGDQSFRAIHIAENNIKSAGLTNYIHVETKTMETWQPPSEQAMIVCNPPYGERLLTKDLLGLYNMIGKTLKHTFAGNNAWIISSNLECLDHMGLRPNQRIKLMNGALSCEFRHYELFAGKRSHFLAKTHQSSENPE
ncbi:THUMP domain-containing class I SAM-dependent RNA methyltransferase [Microbacter margulisiae]|uniref:Putative N6-adenine-specific DNA methylase n=1 Tax=Microbacter margulisiae TaxID=1350067 RepID=A0A7W5H2W4_9PORP|nr:THUMP domain-containing protein [Microbacter margulisiae]MBB3187984.1 putative N6-adenine-specific DNA methylase [Microbacter margulisiae]